ncbi:GNAT family N-acetyltransferase [Saccharibacillus sp. CPCC 101409]|uniref:GNAT family N-acetyltransferase n=1 Tax=Saccharibacillus sp. CPCC 101409 TaxID=3058041 RepID=UPI00267299F9|nr:GNAT family N-acetyltransferase [Saccharibacillus sp. CPCC 101409]MDO3410843.1 GNAT family N-acetyltransferase [Saccharibacillus sp. CPCC 101409]
MEKETKNGETTNAEAGGRGAAIRQIRMEDAENWLELCRSLDAETAFMLYEPGERRTTVPEQTERIASALLHPRSIVLIAECEGRIAGYIEARGSNVNRIRHSAQIVVGILQAYSGRGIGTRLFEKLENWARERGIYRLELTVMAHNEAAVSLYRKMGFRQEGIRKHSLRVEGRYIDEYAMAKLL